MISKILANKTKGYIDIIISPYQSAFIKGRNISNNIIMAIKLFQFMSNSRSKKSYWAAIKLYFKKDFDSVRWDFNIKAS